MSTTETWRVVSEGDDVLEVGVTKERGAFRAQAYDSEASSTRSRRRAVASLAIRLGLEPEEILAPGVLTRAEAVAAARREGAEAMRAAGIAACVRVRAESDNKALGRDRDAACFGARRCRDAIRALPLPGDDVPKAADALAATAALDALAEQARDFVRLAAGADTDPEIDTDSLDAKLVLWRALDPEGADAPWQAGITEEGGMGEVPLLCGNHAESPDLAVANFRGDLTHELAKRADEATS